MAGPEFGNPLARNLRRWSTVQANGTIMSEPGRRLYFAQLFRGQGTWAAVAQNATLYDATNAPNGAVLCVLHAAPGDPPAFFPPHPYYTLEIRRGIYVSYSAQPQLAPLAIGWD